MESSKQEGYIVVSRQAGISKAYWPLCARTGVNTRQVAQYQRSIIIQSIWCIDTLTIVHLRGVSLFARKITIAHATRVGLVIFSTIIVTILFLLYNWSILFVLTVLCMMTTLIVMQLLFTDDLQQREGYFPYRTQSETVQPLTEQVTLATTLPVIQQEQQFPETPMPATPLIRVLETIDLSETDIEHFIERQGQLPLLPPASRLPKSQVPISGSHKRI